MQTRPLAPLLPLTALALILSACQHATSTDLHYSPVAAATQPDQDDSFTPKELRVIEELRTEIKHVEFNDMQLDVVFDYLNNATAVNFVVDWPSLHRAGVEKDRPIRLRLDKVPADLVLKLVLQQASAGTELNPVVFVVLQGIVLISTQNDLCKHTDARVYDVHDLLTTSTNIRVFIPPGDIALGPGLSNSSDNHAQPQAPPATTDPDQDTQTPDAADISPAMARDILVTQLVTLVKESVGRPEEWATAASTIIELNGNLIIRTTIRNHREIILLLKTLRRNQYEDLVRQLRDKEIRALLARAEELRLKQQYEPALQLTNQALRVDPNHPAARAMKEVLTTTLRRSPPPN